MSQNGLMKSQLPLWDFRRWLPARHALMEDWAVLMMILFFLSIFWVGLLWPGVSQERLIVGTAISLAFVLFVFRGMWHDDWGVHVYSVALFCLCYFALPFTSASVVFLFNPGFEASKQRLLTSSVLRAIATLFAIWLTYSLDQLYFDGLFVSIIMLLVLFSFGGDYFYVRYVAQQDALLKSEDEVEALARTAERERIARDLHDLLGHTLSGIRIKAELAGRLMDTDSQRAADEIRQVEQMARASLQQVRATVSGYHEGGIAMEINAARNLLSSAGMEFRPVTTEQVPNRLESLLAFVLREGVTNIVRHANATEVDLSLSRKGDVLNLTLADNGDGLKGEPGHGVTGIKVRARAEGGVARWRSSCSYPGTVMEVSLPVKESDYD